MTDWQPDREKHRFRSRILDLSVVSDRLYVVTERGVYRLDKNGKRYRKVSLPSLTSEGPEMKDRKPIKLLCRLFGHRWSRSLAMTLGRLRCPHCGYEE